jgi:hypothetical protein
MISPVTVFGRAEFPAFTILSNGRTGIRQIVQEIFPLPRFCDSPGTGGIVFATSENRKNASLTPDRPIFDLKTIELFGAIISFFIGVGRAIYFWFTYHPR